MLLTDEGVDDLEGGERLGPFRKVGDGDVDEDRGADVRDEGGPAQDRGPQDGRDKVV